MEKLKVNLREKVESGITDEVENSVVNMLYEMKKASPAVDTPITLVSISVGEDTSLNITLNILKPNSRKSIIDYFEQKGYEVIQ